MLQLYGNPRSRAMRCLWMLEEMGQPYQLIEKSTRADDLQSAEYRQLNPNARIPPRLWLAELGHASFLQDDGGDMAAFVEPHGTLTWPPT
jgi:Glutathione S-transferase, N-terminal domain